MYVSLDRRSDAIAGSCSGSVVVGGWLLAMAAVAAFAFTTGDALRDDDAVLASQSVASYAESISAAHSGLTVPRHSTHPVDAGVDNATPARTCIGGPTTPNAGHIQSVHNRELASRSTHIRSGASISRIAASACRVGASAKLGDAGDSAPNPVRAAGAHRPGRTVPAAN